MPSVTSPRAKTGVFNRDSSKMTDGLYIYSEVADKIGELVAT